MNNQRQISHKATQRDGGYRVCCRKKNKLYIFSYRHPPRYCPECGERITAEMRDYKVQA